MVEEKTSLEVSARYLQGPIFPRVKVKIRLGLVLGLSLVFKVVIVTFGIADIAIANCNQSQCA